MMHESDGEGGQRPREWVNPQAGPDSAPAGASGASGAGQQWYPSQPEPGGPGEVYYASEPAAPAAGPGWYRNQQAFSAQPGNEGGGGFGAPGYGGGERGGGGPRRRRGRWLVYAGIGVLAACIGAGVTVALDHHGQPATPSVSSRDVPGPHNNAAGSVAASAPLNRAAVQRKVGPGLVDINATLTYASETAEGTGMILSPNGLVLTNNHVIDGSTHITATLADPGSGAQSYPAKVVGYDVADDIALLQLEGASNLPTVTTGNSSQVKLGMPVLALGNADGKGGATATSGVLNALNRSIQANDQASDSTENLKHMLQTNALIQQGDSGGALANNAGQVIGMITAANTSTSSHLGQPGTTVGFAIPINFALSIAQQIASGTAATNVYIGLPGFLGVQLATSGSSNPSQQRADAVATGASPSSGAGCESTSQTEQVPARIAPAGAGALVLGVLCQTAAAQLGLAPGDVITSVDGQPVTTPSSLTQATQHLHPADSTTLSWTGVDGAQHTKSVLMGYGPAR